MGDFRIIDLKNGTPRQRKAFEAIQSIEIFHTLEEYDPILVGTIPLDIDIPGSDLDIICSSKDLDLFSQKIQLEFLNFNNFKIRKIEINGDVSIIANFEAFDFDFEVFCQNRPTHLQNAYVHMIVEQRLLNLAPPAAKKEIRNLKLAGLKTEPAFAKLFQITGEPYQALLDLAHIPDEKLIEIASRMTTTSFKKS